MTYDFLKTLYKDLIDITKDLVVKRGDLASAGESLQSIKEYDEYRAAYLGNVSYYNFFSYAKEVLEKILPPDLVQTCLNDPTRIPEIYWNDVAAAQAEYVLAHYVEKNDYYRTLMGLPSLGDHHPIYVKDIEEIPDDVPVHLMSDDEIAKLEVMNVIDDLKKQYPEKEYLRFLGTNRIGCYEAHEAKRFEILRTGACSNPRVLATFHAEYGAARRYTLATLYNRLEFASKDLYDPIVGVLMLSMAIRNVMVPTEKEYLDYEEILDAIIESYGLQRYFKKFPYTYKRRLVLALDHLLANKGTDGVLLDVCKLFSDGDLIANRYYLMKTQTKDEEGNIRFTGDPTKDYTLTMLLSRIKDKDISTQEEYRQNYRSVTDNDYLWQLDADETDQLLRSEFNLLMTKYVDVEAAFDVTSMVFEVCTFINLLLYGRGNENKIAIANTYAGVTNEFATGGKCTLFTMVVFLLAAMAEKAHFDGNIIYEPYKVNEVMNGPHEFPDGPQYGDRDHATIWRFNYEAVADRIREIVDAYELRLDVDRALVEGFDVELKGFGGNANTQDVLGIYVQNRALYRAILEEMRTTQDPRQYEALQRCRDILFTSASVERTFRMSDGRVASTYLEMLNDLDPKLVRKLDTVKDDEDAINAVILYTLEKLEDLFRSNELEYLFLGSSNVYSVLLSKYIRTAINVFKASSVQLRAINICFYLGDGDLIRILDRVISHRTQYIEGSIIITDDVAQHKIIYLNDTIRVGDKAYQNTN